MKINNQTYIIVQMDFTLIKNRQLRHSLSERNGLVASEESLSHVGCKRIKFFKASDKTSNDFCKYS